MTALLKRLRRRHRPEPVAPIAPYVGRHRGPDSDVLRISAPGWGTASPSDPALTAPFPALGYHHPHEETA